MNVYVLYNPTNRIVWLRVEDRPLSPGHYDTYGLCGFTLEETPAPLLEFMAVLNICRSVPALGYLMEWETKSRGYIMSTETRLRLLGI